MLGIAHGWWRRPDRYDWLTGYLCARGLINTTRVVMVLVVSGPLVSLTMLLHGTDGPTGPARVLAWLPTIIGVFAVSLWVWRWPTHTQFALFSVACCTSIALICLLVPDPRSSLTCTYAFMIAGTLLALFQSPKLMLYNFVLVTIVVAVDTIRLVGSGHLGLAAVALVEVLLANIAIPLVTYTLVGALGGDLADADRDPLTGLYNRRAFRNETLGLIVAAEHNDAWLSIALVDLDAFKAVNDTYGHDAGDRVLVQVAQTLSAAAGDRAVVSRSGGEEFLVAMTTLADDAELLADRMCDAIASSPAPITASVGTASVRLDEGADRDRRSLIEELIIAADTAMYWAKRNGGNQTHHYTPRQERHTAPGEPES
ncbi:diguanylate cyclase [Mycolicibacterium rhodesiae JS60]|nr:diguanylate cyclase [Mycolicibacterium rhodesiae JS60]